MTEREHDFLEDLLVTSPDHVDESMQAAHHTTINEQAAPLTVEDEQALMRAVSAVGPVTLAEDTAPMPYQQNGPVQDVAGFVRRYPLQTAAAVAGLAYLLARSRKQ